MQFVVHFEDRFSISGYYTLEAPNYTVALAKAKTECHRFGVQLRGVIDAGDEYEQRSLRDALEGTTNLWEAAKRLQQEDYAELMDLALLMKDREWFESLKRRWERCP